MSNWENDEVTLKIPNDAIVYCKIIKRYRTSDREHQLSESERSLLVQGTTGTEYRIKINRTAKNLVEDKFQLSRTNSLNLGAKFVLMLVMNYEIYRCGDQIVL